MGAGRISKPRKLCISECWYVASAYGWRYGRMTVAVVARMASDPIFCYNCPIKKGGQYVQKIHTG